MRAAARFVVDTHGHITTLYQPATGEAGPDWLGLEGEVKPEDNSALTLYDMDRYGIDMLLLKPSVVGTTNEAQAELVDRYPRRFRAFCSDQTLKIRVARGETTWSLDAAADEVERALKTGKFIGIGEFVPRDPVKEYTFEQRLDDYRTFLQLARKYGVSVDFHDGFCSYGWDSYQLLSRLAFEFRDVPIIFCHSGYSIGAYVEGASIVKKALAVAGHAPGFNIFLETGNWPAEYYQFAIKDPNVGVSQLLWGADYGHVPQYIVANPGGDPPSYTTVMKRWPLIPSYQPDWWGWMLYQIDKIRDWVTQDEINLILGGNAVRLWNLPVPHERMFMSGRPDVWGVRWEESMGLDKREG
jgi:predicted TIM-barrel fold metal-dependent hydrolase